MQCETCGMKFIVDSFFTVVLKFIVWQEQDQNKAMCQKTSVGDYLSRLGEKTCAEDKLRSMRTKLFITEDNFYCTRRCMVQKIETQEVKVDLLILQTKMYCDAYETTCMGESSSDSEKMSVVVRKVV